MCREVECFGRKCVTAFLGLGYNNSMAKLKLDLHDIYNRSDKIDSALEKIIHEAVEKKITLVEIIPGKGSGQLKKKYCAF